MSGRLILSLEDIILTFGGKPLFNGLTIHVGARDRICLIGKNGAGKTTLMRLMTRDLELDGGTRYALPGTSIGYLAQHIDFRPEETVQQFVLNGLPRTERTEHNHYLADIVIGPLDIEPEAQMGSLSGGQKRRAALARALVMDPDLLLLDEPTNHLDLKAIEWLENYLNGYRGSVICVSHDRRFLANVSRKVFWLDRGRIRVCPYSYAGFEEWQEEQIEQESRELRNLQKQVTAEHDWTQGGVTGRRKRNVRRLRELERLREKLKKDKAAYNQRSQKIEMDALEAITASKIVAEFKQVSKHFTRQDGRNIPILKDFNHTLLKGDRLGILGRNGSGKSTFLKLLVGEMEADDGRIFRSKTLDVSYFDQNRSTLNPNKTLWETLCPNGGQFVQLGEGEEAREIHVCGYLKRFLFDPKAAHDKVSTLSGGQQNRLLLAKLLAKPGNLLILDEPTNDLDMDTLDMLQEMLSDYKGTLIIVSHDRDFLDRTVTELMVFEGDAEVHTLFGGYSDYLRYKEKTAILGDVQSTSKGMPTPVIRIEESPVGLKALTYGERLELQKLPAEIEKIHQQLARLQARLDEAGLYDRDPEGFTRLINDFDHTKKSLEASEIRWLELEERANGK